MTTDPSYAMGARMGLVFTKVAWRMRLEPAGPEKIISTVVSKIFYQTGL